MSNSTEFSINLWEIKFATAVCGIIIFSALALVCNLMFLVILYRSNEFLQRRVKWFLLNASAMASIYSLTQMIRFFSYVTKYQSGYSLTISTYKCSLENSLLSFSSVNLGCSMIFIAGERFIATKLHRTYERIHKPFITSVLPVLVLCWLVPVTVNIIAILQTSDNVTIPFCASVLAYRRNSLIIYYTLEISIGVIAIFGFVLVILVNKRRLLNLSLNQAQLNFSARFQLRNNIDISKALLPAAILHLITYLLADCTLLFMSTSYNLEMATKVYLVLIVNVFKTFHLLLHVSSMFLFNQKLRAVIVWILVKKKIVSTSVKVAPVPTIEPIVELRNVSVKVDSTLPRQIVTPQDVEFVSFE